MAEGIGLCSSWPQGRHVDLPCPLHLFKGDETGYDNSEQPHSSFLVDQPGKQHMENGQHLLRQLKALVAARCPGYQLEGAPAHLERQRLPPDAQVVHATPDLVCKHPPTPFHHLPSPYLSPPPPLL